MTILTKAIFISSSSSLNGISGGQQICTQEYLNVLRHAGFELSIIEYDWDQRCLTRLFRKVFSKPYKYALPPNLLHDVLTRLQNSDTRFIFLNVVDLAPLAEKLRSYLSNNYRIILLSHGLASVDFLHEIRAKGEGDAFSQTNSSDTYKLAQQLIAECKQRKFIDFVFCLASFEAEIERWLGAKKVTWLPRTIIESPLDWTPNNQRLGFVGTVDHPPNSEGLILFLEAFQKIAPSNVRFRLVGSPKRDAEKIAQRFPIVEYLGNLSDENLKKEASTWNCFIHPIFCYARGCSTKLAIAIGWQIPIVTTSAGCRGYSWASGSLPIAETPELLAKLALDMLTLEVAQAAQKEIRIIASSSPTLFDVAKKVRSSLFSET